MCVYTVPSHTDPREWVRDAMRQGLSARQILEPLLGDDCPPVGLHPRLTAVSCAENAFPLFVFFGSGCMKFSQRGCAALLCTPLPLDARGG